MKMKMYIEILNMIQHKFNSNRQEIVNNTMSTKLNIILIKWGIWYLVKTLTLSGQCKIYKIFQVVKHIFKPVW